MIFGGEDDKPHKNVSHMLPKKFIIIKIKKEEVWYGIHLK